MANNNKKYHKVLRRGKGSNRRVTPLEIIIATVLIIVLIAVGWLLYTPIYNMIMGINIEALPQNSSSNSQISSVIPETSSQPEAVVPKEDTVSLKATYIPNNIVSDSVKLKAFLDSLKETGVNAVMIDLKDQVGNVLYDSKTPLVTRAQSVVETPIELESTINLIKAEGFVVVGRLHTFMDSKAPNLLLQASVKYQNTDINWIDNYANQGGKLWLNPYSELAQEYISEICAEITKAGVEYVVLDSVQFPTGAGLDKAYYGETANTIEKSEQLSRFTERITQVVEAENAKLFVYLTANSMLGINPTVYGDKPADIISNGLVLGTMPVSMGTRIESTRVVIENPSSSPYDSVLKVVSALKSDIPPEAGVIAMVQAFDNTEADIAAQIKALEESGITSYIYYNPTGNYNIK